MKEEKKKKKAGAKLKVKESRKSKKKKQAAEEFLPEEERTEVWDPEDEETSYYDGEAYEQGYDDDYDGYDAGPEYGEAEAYDGSADGYGPEAEYYDTDGYDGADGEYIAQEYDEAGGGEFADESETWEHAGEEYYENDDEAAEEYDVDTEYAAVDEDAETPLSEDLTGDEVLAASSDEDDYMDELIRSKKLENQPSLAQKTDRDERALIREQERLAQEKRRKKRGKRRNIIIGVVAAVFVVGIWFIGWGYSLIFGTSADTSTVEIVVEAGQEVVYAKLTSVKGNEITYTVAEAVETAEDTENTSQDSEPALDAAEGTPSDDEMPSDAAEGEMSEDSDSVDGGDPSGMTDGEMPSGFGDGEVPSGMTDGEMPSGFDSENMPDGFDGEMPSGEAGDTDTEIGTQTGDGLSSTGSVKASTLAAVTTGSVTSQITSLTADSSDGYTATSLGMGGDMGGGMQGGGGSFDMGSFDMDSFDFSGFGDSSSMTVTSSATDTFTYDDVTYQLTEESNTMLIPVGTDVTTRLGTVTTFSRLAAGDCVALVMQEVDGEDVIMAVYIIG